MVEEEGDEFHEYSPHSPNQSIYIPSLASFLAVVKKINLSAHETHFTSQTNAGIIIGTPPLNPLDVSLLKEKRDRELREIRMAQEQARFMATPRPVNTNVTEGSMKRF